MRVPPRILAVLLFVTVGMLALVVAGLLDWIVGVLFLLMEFLGEVLRSAFRRRKAHRPPPARARPAVAAPLHPAQDRRSYARRGGRPRRKRAGPRDGEPTPPPIPSFRVLVPLSGEEPGLLAFALEECRLRQAELLVLFLRPMAVTPMGPNPLPGLAEDDEANAIFDRIGEETDRLGVPLRTIYTATADRAATVGEVARACKADVVIVGSPRKRRIPGFLSRDLSSSIVKLLPEHASLMIHSS